MARLTAQMTPERRQEYDKRNREIVRLRESGMTIALDAHMMNLSPGNVSKKLKKLRQSDAGEVDGD